MQPTQILEFSKKRRTQVVEILIKIQGSEFKALIQDQIHFHKQGTRQDSKSFSTQCALQPSGVKFQVGIRNDKSWWDNET